MTQIYDLQVSSVYDRLERIDRNLFPNENRSIFLKDQQSFLSAMTDNSSEQILFMKESGQVMTTSGEEYYLDTQTSSLSKLQQNKPIAQSVTWNVEKQSCFLVAAPCSPYTVDGKQFTAIGILYDGS